MQLDSEIKAHKEYSQLIGKNIQETIDICSERLSKNPNDLMSLLHLGRFATKTHQYDLAYEFYKKASDTYPWDVLIKREFIYTLLKLENYVQAKKEILNILDNYKSFKNINKVNDIFDTLATFLNNIFDDSMNCVKAFELSLKIFPEYLQGYTSYSSFMIGKLLELKYSKEVLNKAIKRFGKNNSEILRTLLKIKLKSREFSEADRLNTIFKKKYPECKAILTYEQYDIDSALGKVKNQIKFLENGLKNSEDFAMALNFYSIMDKNILKRYDLDYLIKKYVVLKENKTDDLIQRPNVLLKMNQICEVISRKYSTLKDYKNEIIYLSKSLDYMFERKWVTRIENSPAIETALPYTIKNSLQDKMTKIDSLNIKSQDAMKPIFIIGMPRSGTTLVEKIITYNSQIIALEETGLVPAYLKRLEAFKNPGSLYERYEEVYKLDGKNFTDKDLFNFNYIEVIIKEFPNAKFVHCVRDSKETICSIYRNRLDGISWSHSFDTIMKYYDQYLNIISEQKRKFGKYIMDIQHMELVSDPEKATKKLFSFLELDWSKDCLKYYKNKDLFSQTVSQKQMRSGIDKKYLGKYKELDFLFENYLDKYSWLK